MGLAVILLCPAILLFTAGQARAADEASPRAEGRPADGPTQTEEVGTPGPGGVGGTRRAQKGHGFGAAYPFRGVLGESFADRRSREKPARVARGRGEARAASPAEGGREGPPLNDYGAASSSQAGPEPDAASSPHGALAPSASPPHPPPPRPRPRWFHASYFLDWGLVLGVLGSGAAVAKAAHPRVRPFRVDDRRISLSSREDTVPAYSIAFAAAVPLVTAGLAQIWTRSGQDFHHAALGLAEGMALTFLVTIVLKASVGALRPDFLSRCQPDAQGQCTGDPSLVRIGRESFPSGHTSLFFAGGAYLSLYLWGKLKPFRSDGALWKILAILSPLMAASLVGVTRVTDHRHHWEDVLAGALLGTGLAYLGYRLQFPDPWSSEAGTPRRRTRWVALPVVGPGMVGLAVQGGL